MLNKTPKVKPEEVISEPIDRLVTAEELSAPVPEGQIVTFLGDIKKYNKDSNAKRITVLADGSVIYEYQELNG